MLWLASALILALLAAAVALILQIDAGNVAFLLPPYRIDVSLNLFIVALVLLLAGVYWIARAVQKMADFPERVRMYRARREEVGGQQALIDAAKSLLEGRFARAEKSARAAQSAAATAGVGALIGARAAHRMQEYGRRDDWLEKAERDPAVKTARLVSSAEMWTEQRENDAALNAIERLQAAASEMSDPQAVDTEQIFQLVQSERWEAAQAALATLQHGRSAEELMQAARQLVFLKGDDSHDYKFSSAVLEDYYNVSPTWRNEFLAASTYHLRGRSEPTNPLVDRIRSALA